MGLIAFEGVNQVFVDEAVGGHIVAIAGCREASVGHTITNVDYEGNGIKSIPIDPPTVCMTFTTNDSPLVGQEGNGATSQAIYEWLMREAETNVSIIVKKSDGVGDDPLSIPDGIQVFGRGELQLGIIIENMRRDGFELGVGPPQVVYQRGETEDDILEPVEEVQIECGTEFVNAVMEKMTDRKADLIDLENQGETSKIMFHCPTRGLMGYRNEFLNDTRGTGSLNYIFHGHVPHKGPIKKISDKKGALIATGTGTATIYALDNLQSRGSFFISPGDKVYPGMVIGDHNKPADMECNPVKNKQLNNMRAAGKDEKSKLVPAIQKSLETYIAEIRDDEVIEVTTQSIRLRKFLMDSNSRKKHSRAKRKLVFASPV